MTADTMAHPNARATLLVTALMGTAFMTIAGVVAITVLRAGQDNTQIIVTIVGVTAPIIVMLLGATVHEVYLAVNSRLSELVAAVKAGALAEGREAGQADERRRQGDAQDRALRSRAAYAEGQVQERDRADTAQGAA